MMMRRQERSIEFADEARSPSGVMNRMEKAGRARLDALEKGGVEITDDGVRLTKKPRR
jgi:hypothetical protein